MPRLEPGPLVDRTLRFERIVKESPASTTGTTSVMLSTSRLSANNTPPIIMTSNTFSDRLHYIARA